METLKQSAEKTVQLNDFCRLCLLQKPDLRPLSSQIQTMTIPEMLYKVTGAFLNMQDQLPQVICERCLIKLELAYNIADEFRKQEELLRRLSQKGALVDQLVEYQHSEEFRRKPYSEEIIERMSVQEVDRITFPLEEVPEHQDQTELMDLDEAIGIKQEEVQTASFDDLLKPEAFEETVFSIQMLPEGPTSGAIEELEWKQQTNEIIDNGLEMVLELEDLRTIGALPDELLEQLDRQQIAKEAPKEYFIPSSEEEQSDDDKETDYVPDEIEKDQEDIPNSSLPESESERGADDDADYVGLNPNQAGVYAKKHFKQQNALTEGRFRCEICYKYYESQEELNSHNLSLHKAGRKPDGFECKYCHMLVQRKHILVAHETAHENRIAAGHPDPYDGPHKCPICSRRFHSMKKFRYHMRRHEHLEKGTFKCTFCDFPFGSRSALKSHEKKHERNPNWHADIPPPVLIKKDNKTLYKCSECQGEFTNNNRYYRHARSHTIRKTSTFQCQLCGRCYDNRKNLSYHQRTAHNLKIKSEPDVKEVTTLTEPARPVEIEKMLPRCCECDAFFLSQADYKIHMGVHGTPANRKPSVELSDEDCQVLEDATPKESPTEPMTRGSVWKCDECGESVTIRTVETCRQHKRRHERIRNVTMKCEVCKIAFPSSPELIIHSKANHGHVKQKDLTETEECPFCTKLIKKYGLKKHILDHEAIHLRKYACAKCDTPFGKKYILRKHVVSGICQEPGYVPKIMEPLSTDNIQAFFKWINERKTSTDVGMIEDQDGLFKCKECDEMFEGFASAAYHTSKH